jgi:hypothetical protein
MKVHLIYESALITQHNATLDYTIQLPNHSLRALYHLPCIIPTCTNTRIHTHTHKHTHTHLSTHSNTHTHTHTHTHTYPHTSFSSPDAESPMGAITHSEPPEKKSSGVDKNRSDTPCVCVCMSEYLLYIAYNTHTNTHTHATVNLLHACSSFASFYCSCLDAETRCAVSVCVCVCMCVCACVWMSAVECRYVILSHTPDQVYGVLIFAPNLYQDYTLFVVSMSRYGRVCR